MADLAASPLVINTQVSTPASWVAKAELGLIVLGLLALAAVLILIAIDIYKTGSVSSIVTFILSLVASGALYAANRMHVPLPQ